MGSTRSACTWDCGVERGGSWLHRLHRNKKHAGGQRKKRAHRRGTVRQTASDTAAATRKSVNPGDDTGNHEINVGRLLADPHASVHIL
ncbi:hypothetical protein [Burkholderia mayonis]|uniref:hypothetical protein n=1 Tax=Burkholderia mayonis TaxID=1385591 RepID=UPI0013968D13|nr:hypothetical protein [Burkholderia mayonis]